MALAIFALVAGFAGWVRVAPSDPARWHVPVPKAENRDMAGGVIRVLDGKGDRLSDLDAIIRDTPRTRVLAGKPEDGRVTYVTRSKLWRFPDYTTIEAREGDLLVHARLRFGQSDMGVNRARVAAWLERLDRG
ncbi:DUF1499 domain-containing protein [Lutimaribacter sp. EGI FJ00013]|uniref:DUF1499 domain-containing protein n=1 Tax=Lutimaribacter degradans TaxID=2945989 RepID=A0ACC5ZSR8_9RHOB|nr:DUF1499 domain-containing protein [Lutimaribacter sp. EGI FJ00013]MCM2561220.1 DUF1499 domain-containing protein [Lutimaribacter sp. EGI FJ00013]